MGGNELEVLTYYNRKILKNQDNVEILLRCLAKLNLVKVNISLLQSTGIGKTISALRKPYGDSEVGIKARDLVLKWKEVVRNEEKEQEEEGRGREGEEASDNEQPADPIPAYVPTPLAPAYVPTPIDQLETEREQENPDDHEEEEEEEDHHRPAQDEEVEYKPVVKREVDEEEVRDEAHKKSHKHKKSHREDRGDREDERRKESKRDSHREHKSSKKHKTKDRERREPEIKKERLDESDGKKDREHRKEHKSSKSSHRDRHREREKSDKDRNCDRSKSTKVGEVSVKTEVKEEPTYEEEENQQSTSHYTYNGIKSESPAVVVKEEPGEQIHSSDKDYTCDTDKYSDRDKHSDRSKHSDRDRHRDKHSDKSSSKHSDKHRDREKHKKKKSERSGPIEDDMFAKAMDGMEENIDRHKEKHRKRTKESSHDEVKRKERKIEQINGTRSSEGFDMFAKPPKLSPPRNFTSIAPSSSTSAATSLPEISPMYKPLPRPPLESRHQQSEEETLSMLMGQKKTRSAVYSGKKRNRFFDEVPSLYQLCIMMLQDHVDEIDEVGNLNYDVLKPVLERASPKTLMHIENMNEHLMIDTSELWEKHCKKEFRNKEREEMESWREMYERCTLERQEKLDRLKGKVNKNLTAEKSAIRQTKLAYPDVVAKPPRDVARRQEKNGTGLPVGHVAKVGAISRPRVSDPTAGSSRPAPARKNKVPPMMQKTKTMMKGMIRFGRR